MKLLDIKREVRNLEKHRDEATKQVQQAITILKQKNTLRAITKFNKFLKQRKKIKSISATSLKKKLNALHSGLKTKATTSTIRSLRTRITKLKRAFKVT